MINSNEIVTPEDIRSRDDADQRAVALAQQELFEFVKKTVLKLIEKTETRWSATSCLRQLVRVDLSFTRRGDQISYFVNDIDRGLGVVLWASDDTEGPISIGRISALFADSLHSWLMSRRGSYVYWYLDLRSFVVVVVFFLYFANIYNSDLYWIPSSKVIWSNIMWHHICLFVICLYACLFVCLSFSSFFFAPPASSSSFKHLLLVTSIQTCYFQSSTSGYSLLQFSQSCYTVEVRARSFVLHFTEKSRWAFTTWRIAVI